MARDNDDRIERFEGRLIADCSGIAVIGGDVNGGNGR